MQKLREFLEKIVHDKNRLSEGETYDDFQFGCHIGRVSLAEHILSEYLTDSVRTLQKISCSQCTHWNDGYGNDDICECLGCPQNCDNYTMAD